VRWRSEVGFERQGMRYGNRNLMLRCQEMAHRGDWWLSARAYDAFCGTYMLLFVVNS